MALSQRFRRIYVVFFVLTVICICMVSIMQIQDDQEAEFGLFNIRNWHKLMTIFYNEEKEESVSSNHIRVNCTKQHRFLLGGAIFNETGLADYVSVTVESGFLYSFSPELEKAAAKRVLDPVKDNIFYANSPAITWHNGRLVLVARIWLDKEIYEKSKQYPVNEFADNYLFSQSFNQHLQALDSGEILGIAAPKQFYVGDGPIEPRVFKVGKKLMASFNIAMSINKSLAVDVTCFWNFHKNKPVIPKITGGNHMLKNTKDIVPRDKHWMPFTINDELYFVQNLDPLIILQCSLEGSCFVEHSENKDSTSDFHPLNHHLRGGTPLEVYTWPYYIGFAHVTLFKKKNSRYYTANIVVFHVRPYRLVYVSDPIQIHPDVFAATPMVRPLYIKDNFIFPVSIILEDLDSVVLGAHANDHSSMIFRIKGIQKLMDSVMTNDRKNRPLTGPPPKSVQNCVFNRITNSTNIHFAKN